MNNVKLNDGHNNYGLQKPRFGRGKNNYKVSQVVNMQKPCNLNNKVLKYLKNP